MREPIPTPPSLNDYAKSVYYGVDANGNKFNVERGTDGTYTVTMLNEDGAYETIVLNGEVDEQNNVRFRLPDGKVLYATRQEELDADAYKKAMDDYEKQMDEYKGKEGNYHDEIEDFRKQKEIFYQLLHPKI